MSIFFKHKAGGLSVFQYYVINIAIRNDVIRGPKLWHQHHIGTLLQRKTRFLEKKKELEFDFTYRLGYLSCRKWAIIV